MRATATRGAGASASARPVVQTRRTARECERPGEGRRGQRRRRFAGLLRFALFLVLIFLAAWAGVRVAHAGTEAALEGERYVAAAGDTLWQIALEHYGDDVDLRRAVYEIRVANDFSPTRVLQPGDELVLPPAGDWRALAAFAGQ